MCRRCSRSSEQHSSKLFADASASLRDGAPSDNAFWRRRRRLIEILRSRLSAGARARDTMGGASVDRALGHSGAHRSAVSDHRDTNDRLLVDNYKRSLQWSATCTRPPAIKDFRPPLKHSYSICRWLPSKNNCN